MNGIKLNSKPKLKGQSYNVYLRGDNNQFFKSIQKSNPEMGTTDIINHMLDIAREQLKKQESEEV